MRFLKILATAAVTHLAAATCWAADVALVLSADTYMYLSKTEQADTMRDITGRLRHEGFRVITARSQDVAGLRFAANQFASALHTDTGRVIIVMSGHFVEALSNPWLMGSDARDISALSVGQHGLALNAVTRLLADYPGRAVMLVGHQTAALDLGRGARSGIQGIAVPQGAALYWGASDQISDALKVLLTDGTTFADVSQHLADTGGSKGFLSDQAGFSRTKIISPGTHDERAYWKAVRDLNTEKAYRHYLKRYPNGRSASEAYRLIAQFQTKAQAQHKQKEDDLGLSRAQRKQVQVWLSALAYETRGIDGLFGAGTRSAITKFQNDFDFSETGFLTRGSLNRLKKEAETEERRQTEVHTKQDRKMWRDAKAKNSFAAYDEYLTAFPAGIFGREALQRRNALAPQHGAAEKQAWNVAIFQDHPDSYATYLKSFPTGARAPEAKSRVLAFQSIADNKELMQRYRIEERANAGNSVTRLLVEQRLASLGIDPGPVDGVFDDASRRAIRVFQRSRGLDVFGMVTRDTMLRLIGG